MSELERLLKALEVAFERKGIYKKGEMAKYLGYNRSYFSEVTNGKVSISKKLLGELSDLLNINPRWVTYGEEPMLRTPYKIRDEVTQVPDENYMIAEYADLRCEAGRLGGADPQTLPETHRRLIPKEYRQGLYLVLRVSGDSMNDGSARSLCDGDEILVRELVGYERDEMPIRTRLFVLTTREGNVVKQIKEVNNDEEYLLCHSFNPLFEDFRVPFSDIFQVFQVIRIVHKEVVVF